jgi:hypothetical protein
MSAPFAPSPRISKYCDWARTEAGCTVQEGYGRHNKKVWRITAPSGAYVHQVGLSEDEPLCHDVVASLDRRLGINSPFPKTPDPYE